VKVFKQQESDLRKGHLLAIDSKIQGDELAPTTARLCHAKRHHTTTLGFPFRCAQVVKDQTEKAIARGDLLAVPIRGHPLLGPAMKSIRRSSGGRQPFVKIFHGKTVARLRASAEAAQSR
jgi:hypothetical protein